SAKNISDFINQPLVLQILVRDFSQLFEQAALFSRQRRRRNESHRHKQIAATASTQDRHSLASESKHGSGLSTHRDFDFLIFLERLDHYLGAQRGLRKGDRDGLVQVATLSLKLLVLGYVDNHIQITRRAPLHACL